MSFTFTPIATDNFTPNANPLNPAHWSQSTDGQGEFEPLQALNGTCIATSDDNIDFGEFYTGTSFPSNQYVQIKLVSFVADGESGFALWLRSSSDAANQYGVSILNLDATHASAEIGVIVNGLENDFAILPSFTITAGDVFIFAAIGTTLYLLQNGTVILQGTDSTFNSGLVGIDIDPFTPPNATCVVLSSFVAGSAAIAGTAYSVPDDRDYSVFPNNAVNVQGTETYTVPAHPSHPAPTDSRAAEPTDSREAAIIPENSRNTPH